MSRHAEVLLESIAGRTDAYAIQQSGGHYVAIRSPLTIELLEEYIAGRRILGSYLVASDGKAKFGKGSGGKPAWTVSRRDYD